MRERRIHWVFSGEQALVHLKNFPCFDVAEKVCFVPFLTLLIRKIKKQPNIGLYANQKNRMGEFYDWSEISFEISSILFAN